MPAPRIKPKASKPPQPGVLMARIRQLAAAGAYAYSQHAFDRAVERGIDLQDALTVLRLGEIAGPIGAGEGAGEWKCKVTGRSELSSSREIGVVVVVVRNHRLYLVTVEWEDA
jgi:Domain of unknown function (DUF4258)